MEGMAVAATVGQGFHSNSNFPEGWGRGSHLQVCKYGVNITFLNEITFHMWYVCMYYIKIMQFSKKILQYVTVLLKWTFLQYTVHKAKGEGKAMGRGGFKALAPICKSPPCLPQNGPAWPLLPLAQSPICKSPPLHAWLSPDPEPLTFFNAWKCKKSSASIVRTVLNKVGVEAMPTNF